MKQYDSIPKYDDSYLGNNIIAFDKKDGSNLRFEFSRKKGFYKFGTRKDMIDPNHWQFGFAIELFLNKYADGLANVFNSPKYKKVLSFVCFAELLGTRSEFGQHDFGNDEFDLHLFDINQYKKGLVAPRDFIDDYGHLGIPDVIYEGELTPEFVHDVNHNVYGLTEGVICKGFMQRKKREEMFYYKIKTFDWLERLKEKDIDLYNKEINE